MRKILTTFGTGPAREALKISLPLMAAYAARHDYRLVVPSDGDVAKCCRGRPASWGKIEWLKRLWEMTPPSLVLWLDADVVVVKHDEDINAGKREWERPFLSMVVQKTVDGDVPSCGVMLVNNAAVDHPFLLYSQISNSAGPDGMALARSRGWWEQAAVIKWLGGDPDQTPIVTPPSSDLWAELPYEWNPHPCDPRGIPDDLRFFHATATNDRIGDMKSWAARADA